MKKKITLLYPWIIAVFIATVFISFRPNNNIKLIAKTKMKFHFISATATEALLLSSTFSQVTTPVFTATAPTTHQTEIRGYSVLNSETNIKNYYEVLAKVKLLRLDGKN